VRERVPERSCQRDHVREIMSEGLCQRDYVREIMSERLCQRQHVRECVRDHQSHVVTESMSKSVSETACLFQLLC
jgi:hypothetical protein